MYLVYVNDLDRLEDDRAGLISGASVFFGAPVRVFEEFQFVVASGFGERVIDEFEIAFSKNHLDLKSKVVQVIQRWGFEAYAETPILALSTGWQKYLSLCLFVESNAIESAMLLFAPFHYLDNAHIVTALRFLNRFSSVAVVDFDAPRLRSLSKDFQSVVFESGLLRPVREGDGRGPNSNW